MNHYIENLVFNCQIETIINRQSYFSLWSWNCSNRNSKYVSICLRFSSDKRSHLTLKIAEVPELIHKEILTGRISASRPKIISPTKFIIICTGTALMRTKLWNSWAHLIWSSAVNVEQASRLNSFFFCKLSLFSFYKRQ